MTTLLALLLQVTPSMALTELTTDVCILGGGSAGVGAAIAAARGGAQVALVEKQDRLGGTSTQAYVCNWEPGPGDGLCREIYDRLQARNAVCVVKDHNRARQQGPFGLWLPDPEGTYEQSLTRASTPHPNWRACVFEPAALHQVVTDMLGETGKCRVMLRTTFIEAAAQGPLVVSVSARGDDGSVYEIHAKTFIDCTGGAHVCRALGCATMLGPEPKSRFNEPSAPEEPEMVLNGISLCYRIRRREDPARQAPPEPPAQGWVKTAHVSGLPNGDRIVNPLAILSGKALLDMGYDKALEECRRRVQAHWHWLQGYEAFADFELDSFAPMLGIRESYRVVGEYVLTQHDLLAGLANQTHPDLIALADHSMDVHGSGSKHIAGDLKAPYGIPFRCLIPKGWQNLLVAGRCASFSQIAASSCRLSRTMIQLGHAAGAAAALAARDDASAATVDLGLLRHSLFADSARNSPHTSRQ